MPEPIKEKTPGCSRGQLSPSTEGSNMITVQPITDRSSLAFSPTFDFDKDQFRAFYRWFNRATFGPAEIGRRVVITDENDHKGKPIEGYVDRVSEDIVFVHITNSIPCSIGWCGGHSDNEADSWDELSHYSEYIEIADFFDWKRDEDVIETANCDVARVLDQDGDRIAVTIDIGAVLGLPSALALANALETAARGLRAKVSEIDSAERV